MDIKENIPIQEYRNKYHDKALKKTLLNMIKNIPKSNGSRYYEKHNKNIAIITDEFMFNYYKDGVNLIYINYYNYKEILENNKIDLFIFVSCWCGIDNNDWRGGIPLGALKKDRIYEVIEICKSNNIPTVFQNIEDPSDYNTYIDIAQKCDYIFTSDKDKIDDYKKDCNNKHVFLLEFGINPIIQNPIGIKSGYKKNEVLFAGAWMVRFEERCRDMEMIFEGVLQSNRRLDILDRNFNLEIDRYCFPKRYIPYTTPGVNHEDLQNIHKLYNYIINLNSIKYSSSMCAMRVFEAQALGNLIFSNYSLAVANNNPNIFIINNREEVKRILDRFNEEEIYDYQVGNVRNVMSNKTVFEKLDYILKKVYPLYSSNLEKSILVVVKKITPLVNRLFENQTYKEKYIVEEIDIKDIYQNYDFITFFNDEYTYDEYYLQDMINGFKYTNSDYITKDSYLSNKKIIKGIEHNYVDVMKDKYKTIFDLNSFDIDYLIELRGEMHLKNGYSIDHFELDIDKKMEACIERNYNLSVIIPVYNDGKQLLYKCFNSLKRSKIFEKIEIVLIDQFSTDFETITILNRLERKYSNVKLYILDESEEYKIMKSIERVLEFSKGNYIAFLDANKEVIDDGYYKLYNEISNSSYDMMVGNTIYRGKANIEDQNYTLYSCIMKKNIMKNINLKEINKNVDYFNDFFKQLQLLNKKIKTINEIITIDYLKL
ncbi:MAG: glycosyltransferase [Clostridia bacterium]